MLPVSRFSIFRVVLCAPLFVFFFLWSLHGLWITADDYTFGVLDIFLRNKDYIPHTWLYLRFCALLIYVILVPVHTIILFCTPSVRLLFVGTWVKSRDLRVDRVSNVIIYLFCFFFLLFVFVLRLASCVLNVPSINSVHSWLPLRFFLTFIWFWWISNTSSVVSLLHKVMHIDSTYPEAVFWKAWTLT